eukprot:gene8460-4903_t
MGPRLHLREVEIVAVQPTSRLLLLSASTELASVRFKPAAGQLLLASSVEIVAALPKPNHGGLGVRAYWPAPKPPPASPPSQEPSVASYAVHSTTPEAREEIPRFTFSQDESSVSHLQKHGGYYQRCARSAIAQPPTPLPYPEPRGVTNPSAFNYQYSVDQSGRIIDMAKVKQRVPRTFELAVPQSWPELSFGTQGSGSRGANSQRSLVTHGGAEAVSQDYQDDGRGGSGGADKRADEDAAIYDFLIGEEDLDLDYATVDEALDYAEDTYEDSLPRGKQGNASGASDQLPDGKAQEGGWVGENDVDERKVDLVGRSDARSHAAEEKSRSDGDQDGRGGGLRGSSSEAYQLEEGITSSSGQRQGSSSFKPVSTALKGKRSSRQVQQEDSLARSASQHQGRSSNVDSGLHMGKGAGRQAQQQSRRHNDDGGAPLLISRAGNGRGKFLSTSKGNGDAPDSDSIPTGLPAAAPRLRIFAYCIGAKDLYGPLWELGIADRVEWVDKVSSSDVVIHRHPQADEKQFHYKQFRADARKLGIPFISIWLPTVIELRTMLGPVLDMYSGRASPDEVATYKRGSQASKKKRSGKIWL